MKKAIKFMLERSCAGALLDPGLGKTSITLAVIKVLKAQKIINKTLIIAPLRVCYSVWPEEIKKWDDFKNLTCTILHGKDKAENLKQDVDIYLINPEGLEWLFCHDIKKLGFDVLVIDESSKFKRTNTQRYKLIKPFLPLFRRRYILTGSPVPNGYLDLFGQIYILDLGYALGRFITNYRNTYFYPSGYGGYDWKLQNGAEEKIQDRIRPLTIRLAAEDYLELPEMVINNVYVDLPEKAMAMYKDMEKELIIFLKDKALTAVNAASASTKCRQIASGGIYMNDGTAFNIHSAKDEAVQDIIEELSGTPVLIAYEFQHDRDRLIKALGKNTPYIGGGVSPKRSSELEKAWNRGELPWLLGHPAAIGHGLNLQSAGNHIIWYSLTWNYELYDQFNRRIRRQGAKFKHVHVHHILARNTLDEVVLATLGGKKKTQDGFLDALKDYLSKKAQK